MSDALIGIIDDGFYNVDQKLDSIFASLQRRTTETWNDDLEFALWVLSNCLVFGDTITLGISATNSIVNASMTSTFLKQDSDNKGSGLNVTFSQDVVVTTVQAQVPTDQSIRKVSIVNSVTKELLYQSGTLALGSNIVNPNVSLPAGTYYIELTGEGDTSYDVYGSATLSFPIVDGVITVNSSYSQRDSGFTTFTDSPTRAASIGRVDVTYVDGTGITSGTAESPLIDSTGLFNYDLIDYLIDNNDGSYQVDIVDSGGIVIPGYLDVQAKEYLTMLDVQDVKVKVTLNRSLDTDVSPVIKAVAISYIE